LSHARVDRERGQDQARTPPAALARKFLGLEAAGVPQIPLNFSWLCRAQS
jgi:hypothetical protein